MLLLQSKVVSSNLYIMLVACMKEKYMRSLETWQVHVVSISVLMYFIAIVLLVDILRLDDMLFCVACPMLDLQCKGCGVYRGKKEGMGATPVSSSLD